MNENQRSVALTMWQIGLTIAFADGKAAGRRGRNKTPPLYLSQELTNAWSRGYRMGCNE